MSTMDFGPKTQYSIGPAPAQAHCLIQTPIWPKIAYYNNTGTNQTGKTYIPSEVPSPLIGSPTTYRIFIHESLNIPI